jgi:hypothetical protein
MSVIAISSDWLGRTGLSVRRHVHRIISALPEALPRIGSMSRPLFAWLLALAAFAAPARAEDCRTLGGEEIVALLEQAPTCKKALAQFEACSYASSADVGLSEIVIGKCEADFMTRLTAAERRIYRQERNRCSRKYANQSGTMYRSFEAFCRAKLAKTYALRLAKGAGKHL